MSEFDMECEVEDCEGCTLCDPEYDPTPWCHICSARVKEQCDCGPRANND